MSLKPTIAMFVTCMAPLFLVYLVVDGIYMLQLDRTADFSEEPESDAPAQFGNFIVLYVAFVVAWVLLSMYFAMFGGRKRAEEHAHRKTMAGDMKQRDEGEVEWFDINILKNDMDVGEEEAKLFRFSDVDDEIGDVGLKSGSNEDNFEKQSLGSASGLG